MAMAARSSERNHRPARPRLSDLAAEEEVVGDRQSRGKREVLEYALDPCIAGIHGIAEIHRLAVEHDLVRHPDGSLPRGP